MRFPKKVCDYKKSVIVEIIGLLSIVANVAYFHVSKSPRLPLAFFTACEKNWKWRLGTRLRMLPNSGIISASHRYWLQRITAEA